MGKYRVRPGLLFAVLVVMAGCSRQPDGSPVPPQTVNMDTRTLAGFQEQIQQYVDLRKKILADIPPLSDKSTATELAAHHQALAAAIVSHREGESRGNIFNSSVEAGIREILTHQFSGSDGPALIDGVKQGNPKTEGNPEAGEPTSESSPEVTVAVNAVYNSAAPFSSVPPSLLLNLPLLPEQVSYRFVGRALILQDTEANVILDFIPDVVPDPTIPR